MRGFFFARIPDLPLARMRLIPPQRILFLLFALALIWGLFLPVFDVDAALYAALSMELMQQDNWLQLYERGSDYLDKPPLLFWLNALFYQIFGIYSWVYKLPSVLAGLLGMWYIFRIAHRFYEKETAWMAAAFYGSSIGFFWIASDVKTDLLMSSFLVAAVYHLLRLTDQFHWKDLVFYSLFTALAMMSKGIMGLFFPVVLILPQLLMQKKISILLKPYFLMFFLLTGVLLLPMCIGLYQQFDLHPEKWVHGKQGVSGLRFYFWEQSFGRITGENKWSNHAPFHFLFTHAVILSFPAILLLPFRWFQQLKQKKWGQSPELLSSYGVILLLVLLSLSKYKIPHYAVVILPYLSLYLAGSLRWISEKHLRLIAMISVVLVCTVYLGSYYSFSERSWLLPGCGVLPFLAWNMRKLPKAYTLILSGLFLGMLFNGHLLPSLHRYTETPQVIRLMEENSIDPDALLFYNKSPRSLEFELKQRIPVIPRQQVRQYSGYWFYMDEMGLNDLRADGHQPAEILKLSHHSAERVEPDFLIPERRQKTLQKRYLVRFE